MPTQTIKLTRKGKDPKGPGLLLTRQLPVKIVPLMRPVQPGGGNPYKTPFTGSAGMLAMQKLAANRKNA